MLVFFAPQKEFRHNKTIAHLVRLMDHFTGQRLPDIENVFQCCFDKELRHQLELVIN